MDFSKNGNLEKLGGKVEKMEKKYFRLKFLTKVS